MLVLVAEDDVFIGVDIAEALMQGGHHVLGPARTIADALRLAGAAKPDLALVDIGLRGGDDGTELARILRRDFGVPCVFVSSQILRAREAREAALGCLSKPFSRESLIECVRLARQIGGGAKPDRLPHGLELF